MPVTAQKLADATGVSVRDVENWLGRLTLVTAYHQPTLGQPRIFSRENAVELAMIAALVASGMSPAKAAPIAGLIVRQTQNRFDRVSDWLIFSPQDPSRFVTSDAPDVNGLHKKVGGDAIVCLRAGDIVARVLKLFENT
jgi:hypothetical protein